MAKYLSDEWATAAREALNSSDSFKNASKGVDLTIEQVITGAPESGEARYWIEIKDSSVDGGTGSASNPDVTISQSYETAVAINKQELNAQAAFMQGKLRVTGNMGKLLQHQALFQTMAPILAQVPTEY
ncbi:MAG TPA: SCP2 sterol-binding domain-containing protein [Actinomycetota bacterium]|nr:SCP2 sterol-binding domain-containing protein [Actinomycetota bacterium]